MSDTTDVDWRIAELAERFGTPLYLYKESLLRSQYRALRAAVEPKIDIFYAAKANPLSGVLRFFSDCGAGAEVASEGELKRTLQAGFDPHDIVYTCPGKTRDGVRFAIRNRIFCISIESVEEARLIDSEAREAGVVADTMVRVNPLAPNAHAAISMTGIPSQFGIDVECLGQFVGEVQRSCPSLRLCGIHLYTGTQIFHAQQVLDDVGYALELAADLKREHDFDLRVIDLGGGFGVQYSDADPELDLAALRQGYLRICDRFRASLDGVRLIVESGRFLTAQAGTFVTRVLARKHSRGRTFVICDGGYAHHPAWAHVARTGNNRFVVEAVRPRSPSETVSVVGPSGTPLDILARDVELGQVETGDLLVVPNSGAYGYTNSCQLFFSGPSPAEIMILESGRASVLRARGSLSDGQT